MGRKLETRIPDREPDAVAALAHGRVGQADHRERGKAERDVHLDENRVGVDAEDRCRTKPRKHARQPCKEGDPRKKALTSGYAAKRDSFCNRAGATTLEI
jgi:hypothetical protein